MKCDTVEKKTSDTKNKESIYMAHSKIYKALNSPISKIFGLKKKLTFNEMSKYIDILIAKLFHGHELKYDFSV